MDWGGVIERYRDFLPVTDSTPVVTLKEGNTPLIEARRIRELIPGRPKLFLKCEGFNPTGSFKDRGMTVAISKALEEGAKVVICASTGNTAASAAAYAARAGIPCVVLVPDGYVAVGKMAQALVHGARAIAIRGGFDEALRVVRELSRSYPVTVVNSINPYRIEGQKTGAFEICDQLRGIAPTYHAMPVGNAGNITAYWKGYKEYRDSGMISSLPKMLGFQAEGAAPIVRGEVVRNPETIATAIRIGNPASWKGALAARDESGGMIEMVSDDEIMEAYKILASMEGVFVEPASAASVAGVMKLGREGLFGPEDVIVCVLTGHGLKDPEVAISRSGEGPILLDPDPEAVAKAIGL
jgi:threonine synthase